VVDLKIQALEGAERIKQGAADHEDHFVFHGGEFGGERG
jgi:hypothetical protein